MNVIHLPRTKAASSAFIRTDSRLYPAGLGPGLVTHNFLSQTLPGLL